MLWDVPGCSEALAVVLTRTFYLQNLVSHLFRLIHNVTPDHTSACLIFHEERTSDKGLKHIGGGKLLYEVACTSTCEAWAAVEYRFKQCFGHLLELC